MNPLKYGKCPEKPINLNSIPASRAYLNNLVTSKGSHILYHRIGSLYSEKFPVDHYEIMSSKNAYDDLYINIYSETNAWIPPEGYLFDSCHEISLDYLYENKLQDIDEAEIAIEEKYFHKKSVCNNIEDHIKRVNSLPPLELFLAKSDGRNGRVSNFPYLLIDELLRNSFMFSDKLQKRVLRSIKPRNISYP